MVVAGWVCAFTGTVNVGGHTLTAEWSKSTADGKLLEGWNWDVGAEFRISIKKPGLQGLRP